MPVRLRPRGGVVRIERDQRRREGTLVGDHARLTDERVLLEEVLDVGRRDVLAARSDEDLLLAVDDLDEALVVDLGDVAGVQPPVESNVSAVSSGSL